MEYILGKLNIMVKFIINFNNLKSDLQQERKLIEQDSCYHSYITGVSDFSIRD